MSRIAAKASRRSNRPQESGVEMEGVHGNITETLPEQGGFLVVRWGARGQQAALEKSEALAREKGRSIGATKITGDVNAGRVERLRTLEVNVPGSEAQDGSGPRQVGRSMPGTLAKTRCIFWWNVRTYLFVSCVSWEISPQDSVFQGRYVQYWTWYFHRSEVFS